VKIGIAGEQLVELLHTELRVCVCACVRACEIVPMVTGSQPNSK